MSGNDSILIKKAQIGGRVESTAGTVETLTANDFKTRMITGATAEYDAPREKRDIARPTLTNLGSIESTKGTNHGFRTEINGPDAFGVSATRSMDVASVVWVSGNVIRYTFSATPDLSGVNAGDYFTCNYEDSSINDGTFLIETVNDGSDYIDVINRGRTSGADDTASSSTGIGDVQNSLEFAWAIEASGHHLEGLSRIAIGSVTSGPYHHGETITGGTSSATGRVVVPAKTGDSYIYFEPLTGKFVTAESITGGTSTASATSSSGPIVHGYSVKPISDCFEVATVEYQEDGYSYIARSAMATFTAEMKSNAQGFLDFAFNGARSSNGDKALTTGVSRYQEDPPILKTADLAFDATSTNHKPVFSNVNFDAGANVVMRENGNASDDTGFETARITSREPKITISLEHELASTFDYFSKLDAGTKTALQFHIGTSETKQVWFFADELEFQALPASDNDGIRTLDLEAMLTGNAGDENGDDEYQFAFIGN